MSSAPKLDQQECICPNCGHREPFHPTVPCFNRRCPKCETPLIKI